MNQTFKTKTPKALFSIDLSDIGLNESQRGTIENIDPASLSDEKLRHLKIPGLSPIQNQSVIETIMGRRKYTDTNMTNIHIHKTKRHKDTGYIEKQLEKSLKKIITAIALGIIIIIFQLTMGIR